MKEGLQDLTVYMLGVGRGTSSSAALRNAEKLFRGVAEGADGRSAGAKTSPASRRSSREPATDLHLSAIRLPRRSPS